MGLVPRNSMKMLDLYLFEQDLIYVSTQNLEESALRGCTRFTGITCLLNDLLLFFSLLKKNSLKLFTYPISLDCFSVVLVFYMLF